MKLSDEELAKELAGFDASRPMLSLPSCAGKGKVAIRYIGPKNLAVACPYLEPVVEGLRELGKWDSARKVWLIPHANLDSARALLLEHFGVDGVQPGEYRNIRVRAKRELRGPAISCCQGTELLAKVSRYGDCAWIPRAVALVDGDVAADGKNVVIKSGAVFAVPQVPSKLAEKAEDEDWELLNSEESERTDFIGVTDAGRFAERWLYGRPYLEAIAEDMAESEQLMLLLAIAKGLGLARAAGRLEGWIDALRAEVEEQYRKTALHKKEVKNAHKIEEVKND